MVVELVFSAMHGERFQTCETKVFKNIVGKSFFSNFPWEIVLSTQYATRLTGLLTSWLLRLFSIFLKILTTIKWDTRELNKQTRRRRKRKRHLKMYLRVSAIIFQLFKVIMLEKCVLTILELNWNQRLGHEKTKLNICLHVLTSSTQLQNQTFHVVETKTTSSKCQKMKNARAKRAKILFFIVKYAHLWVFCCRRRRGCLSSLLIRLTTDTLSLPPKSQTQSNRALT